MMDKTTAQTNVIRGQTVLAICLILVTIISGCVTGTRMELNCVGYEPSNLNFSEVEIVQYQNLSDENQMLFKKAINGTRVNEYPSSPLDKGVKYKDRIYDCDTTNIGA
jgi:hypothetical protein